MSIASKAAADLCEAHLNAASNQQRAPATAIHNDDGDQRPQHHGCANLYARALGELTSEAMPIFCQTLWIVRIP